MRINRYTAAVIAALTLCAFSGCASDVPSESPAETTAATTTTATSVTTTTATMVATDDTESTSSDIPATEQSQATSNELDIAQPTVEPTTPDEPSTPTTPDTPAGDRTWNDKPLAATDIVNTDGTYTQTSFDPDTIPKWATSNPDKNWSRMNGKYTSNPSKIPYSEITLENAHEAFPFLGYLGYYPNYVEILPTDDEETIKSKVYDNLVGNSSTQWAL